MNVSSVGISSSYSSYSSSSDIAALEKKMAELFKQTEKESQSDDDAKTKQLKIKQLQAQIQMIEAEINRKKNEAAKKKAETGKTAGASLALTPTEPATPADPDLGKKLDISL